MMLYQAPAEGEGEGALGTHKTDSLLKLGECQYENEHFFSLNMLLI